MISFVWRFLSRNGSRVDQAGSRRAGFLLAGILCLGLAMLWPKPALAQSSAPPQLQRWSLPNCQVTFSPSLAQTPLPLGPDPAAGDYDGHTALFSHNIMHDCKGRLLFFVIDGVVYDEQGRLISDLSSSWGYAATSPEFAIVPVPGTGTTLPQQFYLISGTVPDLTGTPSAFYAILDLSVTNGGNPAVQGDITLAASLNLPPAPNFHCASVHLAVSTLRSDNTHLLYISHCGEVFKYTIDSAGITRDTTFSVTDTQACLSSLLRAEMELVNTPVGYRLAWPYVDCSAGDWIAVIELDGSGNYVSKTNYRVDNNSPDGSTKGLEFSPSGQYLYVTHTGVAPNIKVIDTTAGTLNGFVVSSAADFKASQIELAIDGNLYLAAADRLAGISSPDTPNPANWTDPALGGLTVALSAGYGWPGEGIRLLPDQLDGQNYRQLLRCPIVISGWKWFDVNSDGVRQDDEPGLPGWHIQLDANNGLPPRDTETDVLGNYEFSDLDPGTYTVSEVMQQGWTQTFPPDTGTYTVVAEQWAALPALPFGNHQPVCALPPSNMVAWYPFDEAAGPTAGDIAGTNNGSWQGGVTAIGGKVATAMNFNGSNGYVRVPDAPSINFGTGDLSIDTWIRSTATSGMQVFVDKRSYNPVIGYEFLLYNGRLMFQLSDPSGWYNFYNPSGPIVADGNWHLVAVTVDRDQTNGLKLYVDGVLTGTFNPTIRSGSISNTAELWIGRHHPNVGYPVDLWFRGALDELELFNRALTQAEIQSIYNAGSLGKCKCAEPPANLNAWWPLDETSGTIANDIAGTPTNGTHVNGPLPTPGKVAGALQFNGFNQYVQVADDPSLNFGQGNLSIDAWIKTSFTGGIQLIVDKRVEAATVQGYSFFVSFGRLAFQLANGVGSAYCSTSASSSCTNWDSGVNVADGRWHLVGVTVDRGNPSGGIFYVDGVAVSTFNPTIRAGSLTNSNPLRIGSRSSSVSGLFNGAIDEVELFSRAISATEMQAIYRGDSRGKCKRIYVPPTPTPTPTPTNTPTPTPTPRPTAISDLGDAPDSTNHTSSPMTAYFATSTLGRYPTVYDVTTGAPEGPIHWVPKADAYLGYGVTGERDADLLPDQDTLTNLDPPGNVANRDKLDDGLLMPLNLPDCQPTTIRYVVTVVGPAKQRFINVWFDWNRDGDWEDIVQCPGALSYEWAVQNQVITYGPGVYVVTSPAFIPVNPNPNRAMWLRVTLSERPAPTASSGLADGRGPALGYKYGETEDYIIGQDIGSPDVWVNKELTHVYIDGQPGTPPFWYAVWHITYGNSGTATAANVLITDTLPSGMNYLSSASLPNHEPPAVAVPNVTWTIGSLAPSTGGFIDLWASGPVSSLPPASTISNRVQITTNTPGDPTGNNVAFVNSTLPLLPPLITGPVAGTTCSGTITVTGVSAVGSQVQVYVDSALAGTAPTDSAGNWSLTVSGLSGGPHSMYAVAQIGSTTSSPTPTINVTVDVTLTWDPISLTFTYYDSSSTPHVIHIKDSNGRADPTGWTWLEPRTQPPTYTVSVRTCCTNPASAQVTLTINSTAYPMTPGSGGWFSVVVPAPPNNATIGITCTCDGLTTGGQGVVLIDPDGFIFDVDQGIDTTPPITNLAGRTATALEGVAGTWTRWPAELYESQINPQVTGQDGYYSFFTPPGDFQIKVTGDAAYQPYRSWTLTVISTPVHLDIPLTKVYANAQVGVSVDNSGFHPQALQVWQGSVVEWRNVELDLDVYHTTTSDLDARHNTSGWDSGILNRGETYRRQFDALGTFTYHDVENPTLTGSVQVCHRTDFDCDGQVAIPDIAGVAEQWGIGYDSLYDVNNDGQVNIIDVQRTAADWLWTAP